MDMTRDRGIVVVGSSNTDMVVKADRIPLPGETVIGGEFTVVRGGKGANQAVAAARLGSRVTLIARVGKDVFGEEAVANLRREGIETDYVFQDAEEPTGVALIFVDREGENSIVVAPGANSKLSPEDVETAGRTISEGSVLVTQLEIPLEAVERAVGLASNAGAQVILNPAPIGESGLPFELLSAVDVLVPNESEARVLLGLPSGADIDEKTASDLLQTGVKSAVVTLGSRGVLVAEASGVERILAVKVEAVDTTGAGDAFIGALASRLLVNSGLREAAAYAVKAAAVSVTKLGAQSSLPTLEEMAQFNTD